MCARFGPQSHIHLEETSVLKTLRNIALLCSALLLPLTAYGQTKPRQSVLSHVGGVWVSQNYSYWQDRIFTAGTVAAASPATFQVNTGLVKLPDGNTFSPFFVGQIVNIGTGATQEAVTLTAVSGCTSANPDGTCTISGNTSNAHGHGEVVASSSGGIQEAIQDAANQGGGNVYFEVDCGPVTLNTGSATTTTACKVPLTFTSLGGSAFVKTTVTTATSYSLGTVTTTTAFINACTSLTAGTNCSQFTSAPVKVNGATFALTPLLITASVAPGAGVVHVKAWGMSQVQANN
jgi:hypothetical protein